MAIHGGYDHVDGNAETCRQIARHLWGIGYRMVDVSPKAVATFTTVVQKCDGCDGLHEPYISCDQVGSIDKRKEPSKAVAPHPSHWEVRSPEGEFDEMVARGFDVHAEMMDDDCLLIIFEDGQTRHDVSISAKKALHININEDTGPGRATSLEEVRELLSGPPTVAVAPHRISREQAEKIARAGWSAIEYAGEDLRGPEYAKGYDAALAAAGITVEEQPQ